MKKDILLIVLVLISVGLLVTILAVSDKEKKINKTLEEERYSRMVAEESSQKNAAKISTLEAQLKTANDKMNKVQNLISEEKNVYGDLQRQYDALVRTKMELESRLEKVMEERPVLPVVVETTSTVKSAADSPLTQ